MEKVRPVLLIFKMVECHLFLMKSFFAYTTREKNEREKVAHTQRTNLIQPIQLRKFNNLALPTLALLCAMLAVLVAVEAIMLSGLCSFLENDGMNEEKTTCSGNNNIISLLPHVH